LANQQQLRGVFAPITTPFLDDETLDLDGLASNVASYAASGVHGLLVLGSNGETRSVDEAEKREVLKAVIAAKGAEQVVMAGAAYEAQRHTAAFFQDAAELGADFGLLLPPSYFRKFMTDDVLFEYYQLAADVSPIPLLLYNAPAFSGVALSLEVVGRLAEQPNVVGMKDSDGSQIDAFLSLQTDSFHVLAGSAGYLYPSMLAGSRGGTVALADVFPELVQTLYRYARDRDEARGEPLHRRCRGLNTIISGVHGVAGVKAAMNLVGLRGGIPRRPLLPLDDGQIRALEAELAAAGVLDG
jgi:4-hydroxy-2-oxoglutarate aldolase